MGYAQGSTSGKKRARSQWPVLSGEVFEVGQHPKQSHVVIPQECYTINNPLCTRNSCILNANVLAPHVQEVSNFIKSCLTRPG